MKLGETNTEKHAKNIEECRAIVREIINFGVTEDQKVDIMYFLCLELEDRETLENITSIIKKFKCKIKPEEEAEYDKKYHKTKSNKKLLGI